MNFKQAVADVIAITSRPDKVTEAIAALNQAISVFTTKADFARDLEETTINISSTEYTGVISLDTLVRFRKIKYVKATGSMKYLESIGIDKVFVNSSITKDTFYIAGTNLTYILSNPVGSLEIGYYKYPPMLIDDVNSTHWMLDIIYQAVIDTACARIFKIVGDEVSHRTYQQMGLDTFISARNDFIDSVVASSK